MDTDADAATDYCCVESMIIAHLLLLGVDPARHEHAPPCSPTKAKRVAANPGKSQRREMGRTRRVEHDTGQGEEHRYMTQTLIPRGNTLTPKTCPLLLVPRPYVAIRGWPLRQHVNTHEPNE